jgi:PAS domain S-box-containing protein
MQPRDSQQRGQAEARLTAERTRKKSPAERPGAKSLHELQVYQIELEMQNEALRQSRIDLEASRDRYIDFYDSAPVGYVTLSDSGLITEINLTGAEMLGMDRATLLQRRFSTSVATGGRDHWQEHLIRVLSRDAKLDCELTLVRPDGSCIDVRLDSLRVVKDGHSSSIRTVLTDITERKRVENALTTTINFSNKLTEFMQEGLSMVDAEGAHLDVNPAMCRITGFSREELLGSGMPHLYWPPEEYDTIQAAFQSVLKGDYSPIELTFMRKNGERFPVVVTPSVVRGAQGHVLGYMATMKDITESKQVDEALKASEQRFRDIVNTTDGIVWEADATTLTFTFVSDQAERLLGYPVREWLKPGFWVEHLHPDDKIWAPGYCASYTEGMAPHDFEYRFIARDGRTVWLHDIVTVVPEEGAARWLRGIMVDITHRKLVEEKLREMAADLEQMVDQRTKELRTLSAQLTMTEERERRMLAQDLHDNLGQLLAVIKIKLSSLIAGSLKSPVNQIIRLVDQAEQSARSITLQLSPPLLHTLGFVPALEWLSDEMDRVYGIAVGVHTDICEKRLDDELQTMLYRSARELLINVARHARVKRASLSCMCSEGRLVLVVSDDGRGFDPAGQGDTLSERRSFGLNSIYERIATIGGEMDIDSSPGNGTTISLSVPCCNVTKEACDDSHHAGR